MASAAFLDYRNRVFRYHKDSRYREAIGVARDAAEKFPDYDAKTSFWIACLQSRLGQHAEAILTLQDAVKRNVWWPAEVLRDTDLDPIRGRPEFKTLEFRSDGVDRKSTRLNSSHGYISYAVFGLKKNHTHAEYEATEEHLAIHTLSSHPLPAEAVVARARPHNLVRITRPADRTCCLTSFTSAHRARSSCPSTTSCGFASALVIRGHRRGARYADGGCQRLPTSIRCRTAPAVTREFVV